MKYIILLALPVLLLLSCNNSSSNNAGKPKENATDSLINGKQIAGGTDQAAAKMIAANDCLTCHTVNGKSLGPSFVDIANKYEVNEGNIANLAHGIRNGSKGIWGDAQMIPHQNVTPNDAQAMAKYILSLRPKSE